MPQLLVVILDDLKPLPDLLAAWRTAGVGGATILESVGAYRAENWLSRAGLGALSRLFEAEEVRRRTILSVVDDEVVDAAVAAAEKVVGGFGRPNSGLLMVVPLTHVLGLRKDRGETAHHPLPDAVQPDWLALRGTRVEVVADILHLEPTLIPPDMPLVQAIRAMLVQPNVHVACVVEDDRRLSGILDLQSLADNLFFHIFPEEFLSEVTDLEDVMQFADRSRVRTAADAMQAPVWVQRGETVKEAFKRMHEHRLSGLPVVDEHHRVEGYVNLLELLALGVEKGPGAADEGNAVG